MLKLQLPALLTQSMRLPLEPTTPGVDYTGTLGTNEALQVSIFLDDVVQRLAPLPAETHGDIRAELRAHLEASIAAHEELGDDHEAATVAAILQFGEPKTIASRFSQAWKSTTQYETLSSATRMGLKVFAAALAIYLAGFLVIIPFTLVKALQTWLLVYSGLGWFWGGMVSAAAIGGAYIGWKAPKYGARSAFFSLLILVVCAAPFCVASYYHGDETGANGYTPAWYFWNLSAWLCPLFLIWLPIASSSALASSVLKLRRRKSRLRPYAREA